MCDHKECKKFRRGVFFFDAVKFTLWIMAGALVGLSTWPLLAKVLSLGWLLTFATLYVDLFATKFKKQTYEGWLQNH